MCGAHLVLMNPTHSFVLRAQLEALLARTTPSAAPSVLDLLATSGTAACGGRIAFSAKEVVDAVAVGEYFVQAVAHAVQRVGKDGITCEDLSIGLQRLGVPLQGRMLVREELERSLVARALSSLLALQV